MMKKQRFVTSLPHNIPSFRANSLDIAIASSDFTVIISSHISLLKVSGINPAPIP